MKLPKTLLTIFTTYCLGSLSTIYRRVIYRRFSLGHQAAGMAARLLTHGSCFFDLDDVDEIDGIPLDLVKSRIADVTNFEGGLKGKLNEMKTKALTTGKLNEMKTKTLSKLQIGREEMRPVASFSNFAFQVIRRPNILDRHENERRMVSKFIPGPLRRCFRPLRRCFLRFISFLTCDISRRDSDSEDEGEDKQPSDRIYVEHFVSACLNSDSCGFMPWKELFDIQRKIGRIERMFMPEYLMEYLDVGHRSRILKAASKTLGDSASSGSNSGFFDEVPDPGSEHTPDLGMDSRPDLAIESRPDLAIESLRAKTIVEDNSSKVLDLLVRDAPGQDLTIRSDSKMSDLEHYICPTPTKSPASQLAARSHTTEKLSAYRVNDKLAELTTALGSDLYDLRFVQFAEFRQLRSVEETMNHLRQTIAKQEAELIDLRKVGKEQYVELLAEIRKLRGSLLREASSRASL